MPAASDSRHEHRATLGPGRGLTRLGPAALTEGLRQLHQLIAYTVGATPSPLLACEQRTHLPAAADEGGDFGNAEA